VFSSFCINREEKKRDEEKDEKNEHHRGKTALPAQKEVIKTVLSMGKMKKEKETKKPIKKSNQVTGRQAKGISETEGKTNCHAENVLAER